METAATIAVDISRRIPNNPITPKLIRTVKPMGIIPINPPAKDL